MIEFSVFLGVFSVRPAGYSAYFKGRNRHRTVQMGPRDHRGRRRRTHRYREHTERAYRGIEKPIVSAHRCLSDHFISTQGMRLVRATACRGS
jgi:hypothetical protein